MSKKRQKKTRTFADRVAEANKKAQPVTALTVTDSNGKNRHATGSRWPLRAEIRCWVQEKLTMEQSCYLPTKKLSMT